MLIRDKIYAQVQHDPTLPTNRTLRSSPILDNAFTGVKQGSIPGK